MNSLKFYKKVISALSLKPNERLLIGKLANSANSPNIGFIDVYFEVIEGVVKRTNPVEFMDSSYPQKSQVFVRGGYENYEKEYGYNKFFLIKACENTQSTDKGNCLFVCVYNFQGETQHLKINKDCPFIAEISNSEFSSSAIENLTNAHTIDSIENDFLDTPNFFQIDTESKKILGPLISSDIDKSIFHGPRNEISYEFWHPKSASDYQTFMISYEGYEDHIVNLNIDNKNRSFFINLDTFYLLKNNKPRPSALKSVDLIPNNCLVNEFYKNANKAPTIKPFQKNKIKLWLDNKSIKIEKKRKDRLFNIFTNFHDSQESVSEVYKRILDSEISEPILKRFALEDEERYLDRYRQKENLELLKIKEETENKRKSIEQQNNAIKEELSKNQKKLFELNKEKNNLQKEVDEKLRVTLENIEESEEYENRMNDRNNALSDINKKIEHCKSKYGHYEDIEALEAKENSLKEDNSYLERKKIELQSAVDGLKKKAQEESSVLATAYLNQQIISDIQNHDHYKYLRDQPNNSQESDESFVVFAKSNPEFVTDDHNQNRKLIVKKITNRLRDMNRSVKSEKVEATLIAILQNQYSVFIGIPGSGKTSFAIQLGCALGANKSTLAIPVSKDWTRPKDLMGYYNPITNIYEPGVTNFYPFYKSIGKANEKETTNSLLILDEFNLSQPEFYMSNLMGLADNSGSRTINLGHNTNINIPETSRFICTANTDETVQGLSPRMISRCAFILFNDLPELDHTVNDLIFPEGLEPLLTGTDMINLFTASDSDVISDSLKSDIDTIITAFREADETLGNGISITPRKYKQLLHFCKVMDPQEHGQAKVLDYATNFFLLPLISGSGDMFKNRLINIQSVAEDLSLEDFSKQISSIINKGESNFDQFHFIMR